MAAETTQEGGNAQVLRFCLFPTESWDTLSSDCESIALLSHTELLATGSHQLRLHLLGQAPLTLAGPLDRSSKPGVDSTTTKVQKLRS